MLIQRPKGNDEAKGNKGLPPAESGKVLQDPHHPRTKENELIKATTSEDL
jgi:hypothetical protein